MHADGAKNMSFKSESNVCLHYQERNNLFRWCSVVDTQFTPGLHVTIAAMLLYLNCRKCYARTDNHQVFGVKAINLFKTTVVFQLRKCSLDDLTTEQNK
jgi:hypothetical protein